MQHLRKAALHRDLRVRATAVRALVHLDRALPEQLVQQLLETPDPPFVERTIAVLGRGKVRGAVRPLMELIQQRDRLGRHKNIRDR